jgi:predicted metal-dependent hydrolase
MMIDYTLIRSRRKTCAICVSGGIVTVRAPLRMSRRDIDAFVRAKADWIERRVDETARTAQQRAAFTIKPGDKLRLRGGYITAPNDAEGEKLKALCIKNYKKLAKQHLTERTEHFAAIMGNAPVSIKITSAKTRWGSCTAKKTINYSWRLIMAPDELIDYVVVHELAHLKQMNHSEKFWAEVAKIIPDHKARRAQLKKFAEELNREDWD